MTTTSSHLSEPMKRLIEHYSAGAVATVNDDGTPAVSPKATFVVVNERCIAYGDIRSPGTAANLRARPAVEVGFIDVLTRRAVRVKGTAVWIEKGSPDAQALLPAFEATWAPYLDSMSGFVRIDVTRAELVLSPAYDIGHTADALARVNLDKLTALV